MAKDNILVTSVKTKEEPKKGDWVCPNCKDVCFEDDSRCAVCKECAFCCNENHDQK